jgi:major membrane immunogen (membrane-anchored lipoprotein)
MLTQKMTMFKSAAVMLAVALLAGCGAGEPSNKEIAQGMMRSFVRETDINPNSGQLKAKAHKIGNGRWAVTMEVERYGERHTLNATAVMDKNGDIHYYTD